jgi:septum formation protein
MTPALILASSSPRRRELLSAAGFEFEVVPARDGAEHNQTAGRNAAELVEELAVAKARDVADQLANRTGRLVVLGADTVAECAGEILGKPRDAEHAREILLALSGRRHRVLTGVCLLQLESGAIARSHVEVVSTELEMSVLSEEWLASYLATGRWAGKAGAFGYQEGLDFVQISAGSESNVVGLPMECVITLLAIFGCFPAVPGKR